MDTISRRRWMAFAGAAGLSLSQLCRAATLATEERAVSGFDTVSWEANGDLLIEQTGREHLSIEAEAVVLAKIVTEVRGGRLRIRFGPGSVQTRLPIRFRVEVKSLSSLETRGAGSVRIGPLSAPALSLQLSGSEECRLDKLDARALDARLDGSGEITISGGRVDTQHIVIAGSARYDAVPMASRRADVAIEGSGEMRLAVSERLDARISGSGDVLYRGRPVVTRLVTGAGEIQPLP
ncbi:MAG: DUF2807 domain-containing protein [Burkholderiales bacterium]|nr:DUF2807 domain-containing protein [Burkholderiales bacterium]